MLSLLDHQCTPPGPKQCLRRCIYCYAREAVTCIGRREKSRIAGLVGNGLEDIDASIVGVAAKGGMSWPGTLLLRQPTT